MKPKIARQKIGPRQGNVNRRQGNVNSVAPEWIGNNGVPPHELFSVFNARNLSIYDFIRVVKPPPGNWLLKVADNLCRPKTVKLVNEMIADLQAEYFECLSQKRYHKAKWILVLNYYSIAKALTVTRIWDAVVNAIFVKFGIGKP